MNINKNNIKKIYKKILPINDIFEFTSQNLNLINPIIKNQFKILEKKWTIKSKKITIDNYWYVLTSNISYVKYLKYQHLKEISLTYFQYKYFLKMFWISIISLVIVVFGPVLFATILHNKSNHFITIIIAVLSALPVASISFGIGSFLSLFQKRKDMEIKFYKYFELLFIFDIKNNYEKEIKNSSDAKEFINKIDLTKTFNVINNFKEIIS